MEPIFIILIVALLILLPAAGYAFSGNGINSKDYNHYRDWFNTRKPNMEMPKYSPIDSLARKRTK